MGDGSAFGRERVAQYLRHDLGVTEIAHEPLLCISEREMSGACVADSFARAKGPEAERYIHHTPGGAQAAGCIDPSENVRPRVRVCQSRTMPRFPDRKQIRPATRRSAPGESDAAPCGRRVTQNQSSSAQKRVLLHFRNSSNSLLRSLSGNVLVDTLREARNCSN